MNILITGSSGFIGYSLALKLLKKKNNKILGFDSINDYYDKKLKISRNNILKKYKNFHFVKGKLENLKLLKKSVSRFKPKIIIHLAAQAGVRYSIDYPEKYISSNIIGSFNILQIAKELNVKHLLIASSSSVYGSTKKKVFKEIDKSDNQISVYASSKKSIESLSHSYSYLWKLPITILRFFTVYGPYGRPDMAYYKFTKSILNKKTIDVYNKGKMYRDFTYIDDVTKSIELLINKVPKNKSKIKYKYDNLSKVAPFRIINIGNQKKIFLNKFINLLEKNLKIKAKKKYQPLQKGDVKETLSNTNLLNNITKFRPNTSFKFGIKKFIDWYKNYYKIKEIN